MATQPRGRVTIRVEECKGCALCVKSCPPKCLELASESSSYGVHPAHYLGTGCTGCGICFYCCPEPGAVLYNGNRIPADLGPLPARILWIPASAIADKLGSAKVANMVLLGALLEEVGCLDRATARAVIQTKTGKSALREANAKALEEGRKSAEEFSRASRGLTGLGRQR